MGESIIPHEAVTRVGDRHACIDASDMGLKHWPAHVVVLGPKGTQHVFHRSTRIPAAGGEFGGFTYLNSTHKMRLDILND
jgi:hypothetical protein